MEKRTSGYGKFQAKYKNMDPQLKQRLNVNKYQKMMSLSISLPKDDEIEKFVQKIQFSLIKRSGFVNSMTYADTFSEEERLLWFCGRVLL